MYKLILTDINMPEIDGFQMARMIREKVQGVKIYAVTAMNDGQIRDVYKKYGIEKVLTKPVKTSDLQGIIGEIFY